MALHGVVLKHCLPVDHCNVNVVAFAQTFIFRPTDISLAHGKALVLGLQSLMHFYVPALFAIGRGVRRLFWEGAVGGPATGLDARKVLEQCLNVHAHATGGWRCTAEYSRTLSVALLAWQPYFNDLPGCCFVEEAGEALLSRMAGRMKRNSHVTEYEDVVRLFQTVPPPRGQAGKTTGGVRKQQVQLVWNRLIRVATYADDQPYARLTSTTAATWEQQLPDDLKLPERPVPDAAGVRMTAILRRAVTVLAAGTTASTDVMGVANAQGVPQRSDQAVLSRQVAMNTIRSWTRRRGDRAT